MSDCHHHAVNRDQDSDCSNSKILTSCQSQASLSSSQTPTETFTRHAAAAARSRTTRPAPPVLLVLFLLLSCLFGHPPGAQGRRRARRRQLLPLEARPTASATPCASPAEPACCLLVVVVRRQDGEGGLRLLPGVRGAAGGRGLRPGHQALRRRQEAQVRSRGQGLQG